MKKGKIEQIKNVGRKYDLDFILLYGSQAKGQSITKETDVDLAIFKKSGVKSAEYLSIYLELNRLFGGQNLDLKTLAGVDPLLRFQIIKDGILLYVKNPTFYHEFYSFAYKDYHDSQSLFNLEKLMQEKRQQFLENKYG